MSNEQKYDEVLKALGEALAAKNDALYWANYSVEQLKEKLEAAENRIKELEKKKDW